MAISSFSELIHELFAPACEFAEELAVIDGCDDPQTATRLHGLFTKAFRALSRALRQLEESDLSCFYLLISSQSVPFS